MAPRLSDSQVQSYQEILAGTVQKLQEKKLDATLIDLPKGYIEQILSPEVFLDVLNSQLFQDETVPIYDLILFLICEKEEDERYFFQELSVSERRAIYAEFSQRRSTLNLSGVHESNRMMGEQLQAQIRELRSQNAELNDQIQKTQVKRRSKELETSQLRQQTNQQSLSQQDGALPLNEFLSLIQTSQKTQFSQLQTYIQQNMSGLTDSFQAQVLRQFNAFRDELGTLTEKIQTLGGGAGELQNSLLVNRSQLMQKLNSSQAQANLNTILSDLQDKMVGISESCAKLSRLVNLQLDSLGTRMQQIGGEIKTRLGDVSELMEVQTRRGLFQKGLWLEIVMYGAIFLLLLWALMFRRVLKPLH